MRLFRQKKQGYQGSSEHLRQNYDIYHIVNLRLQVFMAVLLVLASILIYRLYTVQVTRADHFASLLLQQQTPTHAMTTLRGVMMDRNHEVLVSNKAINAIVFEKKSSVKDSWTLAETFVQSFPVKTELNEHDQKLLWLFLNDNGKALITDQEREDLTNKEIEALKLERVDVQMLASLSEVQKQAFKVKVMIDSILVGQSTIIIESATSEQISYLAEHAASYPGFSFETSWTREVVNLASLSSIFGSMSQIPYEKLDYYLAEGYARDDIVGSYGLEYQYEHWLSGIKTQYTIGEDGSTIQVNEGRKGYDLRLSIDSKLQAMIEETITNALKGAATVKERRTLEQIMMVVADPNTGDVLALADIIRNSRGEYVNDPQSVMLSAYPAGSVVKGATVYMGLDTEAIQPGQVFMDEPMYIRGTIPRVSWRNLGSVSDLQALQLSSNIYMFHIAIRLGGTQYVPNGALVFPDPDTTYATMRNYYSRFGLGVKTMIDFDREAEGYKGYTGSSGQILELAIGQFDSYTAMQLSQYINTIANGGYRLKPRLLLEVLNHDTKTVVYQNNVEVLNTLDNDMALDRVREGLRLCVITNNCGALVSKNFTSGAKTGTAQVYDSKHSENVVNSTFIAFAPFDNPVVTISCIAPSAYIDGSTNMTNICRDISATVLDYYMNRR